MNRWKRMWVLKIKGGWILLDIDKDKEVKVKKIQERKLDWDSLKQVMDDIAGDSKEAK